MNFANLKIDTESVEDTVKYILKTYELPPQLEEKITRIATMKANDLCLFNFDDIYSYISDLIDRFRRPYQERFFLKLGRPITDGTKNTFHEIIEGGKHEYQEELFAEELNLVPISEMPKILEGHLDDRYIGLLSQLVSLYENSNGNSLNFFPEKALANAEQIQERLEELAEHYGASGGLIIPKRKIFSIKFNPLVIRFGKRPQLSDKERNEIIALYEICCGNAAEAKRISKFRRRLSDISYELIKKVWKERGLKPIGRTGGPPYLKRIRSKEEG